MGYRLRFEMLSIFKYNINIELSLAQQMRLFSVDVVYRVITGEQVALVIQRI